MDETMDLERTAKFIRGLDVDFAGLSEVDAHTKRSADVNQAMRLGELTGLHAVFGKAMPYDGGYYGEAILSRRPFEKIVAHPLPASGRHEPRVLMEAHSVTLNDKGLRAVFFDTHLDHETSAERLSQVREINRIASIVNAPLMILVGDFNDSPDNESIREIRKLWTDAGPEPGRLTWPADKPTERIDYIFYRSTVGMKVTKAEVLDEPLVSDHRPVFAVIEIP